ncbi:uncharacterized protein EI90DRAFT_1109518 [Cantharellus anzutake]|uniref:uncharacterized protein n=1 Tax=Cantharellus anzutake TaxID=1750568 RepID=UPI00190802FE|nr:uncharacterized protein EI90DRAFT_1109518 [Cantharellus anzutake]KAF8330889.1 hypothetical protein EI90DRAFT_1109518 [Cantharellus anzutake]
MGTPCLVMSRWAREIIDGSATMRSSHSWMSCSHRVERRYDAWLMGLILVSRW